MADKPSVREIVKGHFDAAGDVAQFRDKKVKRDFFDKVAKENPDLKRPSIEATFSVLLKQHCRNNGIDFNEFSGKPQKRFSSALDVQPGGKPVELTDQPGAPKLQNPAAGAKPGAAPMPVFPLESVAGSVNSVFRAIDPDIEALDKQEREDASACLNMAFGTSLQNSERARQIIGVAGILGIYGGKITAARAKRRKRKADVAKAAEQKAPPLADVTPAEQQEFAEAQAALLAGQRAAFEAKGVAPA